MFKNTQVFTINGEQLTVSLENHRWQVEVGPFVVKIDDDYEVDEDGQIVDDTVSAYLFDKDQELSGRAVRYPKSHRQAAEIVAQDVVGWETE